MNGPTFLRFKAEYSTIPNKGNSMQKEVHQAFINDHSSRVVHILLIKCDKRIMRLMCLEKDVHLMSCFLWQTMMVTLQLLVLKSKAAL